MRRSTSTAIAALFALIATGVGASFSNVWPQVPPGVAATNDYVFDFGEVDTANGQAIADVLREAGALRFETMSPDGDRLLVVDSNTGLIALRRALIVGRLSGETLEGLEADGFGELAQLAPWLDPRAYPAGPDAVNQRITYRFNERRDQAIRECMQDRECAARVRLRYAAQQSFAEAIVSAPQSDACNEAVMAYLTYLQNNCDRSAVCTEAHDRMLREVQGPRLDRACLSTTQPPIQPRVAIAGGGSEGVQGALMATAVFISINPSRPGAFCTGLFVSNRQVATAFHCWNSVEAQDDLRNGRVVVRRLGRMTEGPWVVENPPDEVTSTFYQRRTFANDRITMTLRTGPASVPRVRFAVATPNTEVFVASVFRHADMTRVPGHDDGIRWTNQGLCRVYESDDRCVRVFCQTISGYSGAPIFGLETSGDALVVHGFVSGGESREEKCGARDDNGLLLTAGPVRAP